METKKCSKCCRELSLTSYYFHRGGSKTGYKSECKECRGFTFGETRKTTKIPKFWTTEKINTLKDIYADMTDKEISIILGTTENAINTKANCLNLKKNLWWNEKEINMLKFYYSNMITEDLKEKFLPNRSILSIRKKAFELKIDKNKELIKEISMNNLGDYTLKGADNLNYKGIKNIYEMCRNSLNKWIEKIKEKYEYRCYISGQKENLIVHHIKPFREIFQEVLDVYIEKYNFQLYEDIDSYYKNNQENLLKEFIKSVYLAHTESDGILISEDLHKEFHNIYGTRHNTKNDFYKFLDKKGVVLL